MPVLRKLILSGPAGVACSVGRVIDRDHSSGEKLIQSGLKSGGEPPGLGYGLKTPSVGGFSENRLVSVGEPITARKYALGIERSGPNTNVGSSSITAVSAHALGATFITLSCSLSITSTATVSGGSSMVDAEIGTVIWKSSKLDSQRYTNCCAVRAISPKGPRMSARWLVKSTNDPYSVHEYATDVQRRTKFTGEVTSP